MSKEHKPKKRFSLLRLLLVIALKNVFNAETARQYILGNTEIAEDIRAFEAWRYKRYCIERGIKTGETVTPSQATQANLASNEISQ